MSVGCGELTVAKVEIPTTTARVPLALVDRVVAIAGLRKASPASVWHELFQAVADQAYDDEIERARAAREAERGGHAAPPKRRK